MSKRIIKVLIVILALIAGYSVYSSITTNNEIKALRKEMQLTADSLNQVSNQYDVLEKRYDSVALQLVGTRDQLVNFHQNVDSIMNSNIRSVGSIHNALNSLVKKFEAKDSLTNKTNEDLKFPM